MKNPSRVARGKLIAEKIKGAQMERDITVQTTTSSMALATIAKFAMEEGNHVAIKSLSSLGHFAIESLAAMINAQYGETVHNVEDAIKLLDTLGLIPRSGRNNAVLLRNLQRSANLSAQEEITSMPDSEAVDKIRRRRAMLDELNKITENGEEKI